ncbi:UNVERIFIED_CONTAM: hypothetical protein GTU68_021339 [Idotea baltica]|nr:hypothetical protein [Idotea baltica]
MHRSPSQIWLAMGTITLPKSSTRAFAVRTGCSSNVQFTPHSRARWMVLAANSTRWP